MADPLADLARLPGVPSAVAAATAAVDVVLHDRGLRRVDGQLQGRALAGTIRVAPAQALARAHALVARGIVPDERLGLLDAGPVISRRMRELGELLVRPTGAPAIVLAAVVHAEIATMAPFAAASGLVARAAEHLVLVASGLDPYGVIVVEAGHAADPARYRAGLAAYPDSGLAGVSGWILQCAAAVARGAEISPAKPVRERTDPSTT